MTSHGNAMPFTEKNIAIRYAWISLLGALLNLLFKGIAWRLTGSIGLFSDALETLVNVGSGCFAIFILHIAYKPPDANHPHGHDKAEYFFSGFEGSLILIAALSIAVAAIYRWLHPQPLEQITVALGFSTLASLLNLMLWKILLNAAKQHQSITLESNANHLLSDIWTSIGVILGIALVQWTGKTFFDPLVALFVAIHILWIGYRLLRSSIAGLMDESLPASQIAALQTLIQKTLIDGTHYHALRTRYAGRRCFISLHLLVPGNWTVQQGRDLAETVEQAIGNFIKNACIITQVEPIEDHRSWIDQDLDHLHHHEE